MKHPAGLKEVIKLDNVCKTYTMGEGIQVTAVCGMHFVVHEGDLIGVLGPSGSGKSTLLHIMGLLDSPTSGEVYIDGIKTTDMSADDKARVRGQKIGFVFQTFNLVNSLTALENVMLPMMIQGISAAERERKATAILTQLNMANRLTHHPSELSGGQRQRVAIARALANDPAVILADEPTGNLDSKTGKEVLDILKNLNKQGKTIIIITHDTQITKMTKEVWRIRDGKLTEETVG